MSFCTNCGAKLEEHEVYCYNCGFKVIDEEQKSNEGYTQYTPEVSQNHNVNRDQYVDQNSDVYQDVNQNPNVYNDPNRYQGSDGYPGASSYQNPDTYQTPYVQNQYGYQNPYTYPSQNIYPYPNMNADRYYYAKRKNKKVGVILGLASVAFIAILAIIISLIVFRAPAYERPLKNLTNALEDGNYVKLLNCYPEYYQDVIARSMDYYGDSDDAMDELMDRFEETYGEGIKITYKIKDKEKLYKNELTSLEDSIKKKYEEDVTFEEGYKLKVELRIEGDDDGDIEKSSVYVIKIDSKWYLIDNFMDW